MVALTLGALSAQAQTERQLWDPVEEESSDLSFASEGMTIELDNETNASMSQRVSLDGLRLASNPSSDHRMVLTGLNSSAPAADAGSVFKTAPIGQFQTPLVSGASTYPAPIAPASGSEGFSAGLVLPVSGVAGLMACGVLFAALRPRS